MNHNESMGPTLFWLVTWYMLGQYMDAGVAFLVSLLYFAIGKVAIRMCGRVVFRHGAHGWFLLAQIVGWFVLFFFFVPLPGDAKFLILWGIGIPLIFLGGIGRCLWDRFPNFQAPVRWAARRPALGLLLVPAISSWFHGDGFWTVLVFTIASAALSVIPLYYGWTFAKAPPRGDHDARFGSDEHYRAAGMSDER